MSKKKEENPMKGSCVEYFSTISLKLKKRINIKDLIAEEVQERNPTQ